jgi:hypothetical protein
MTDWFHLSAPPKAPTGVDPVLRWRLIGAANRVADRVTRCYAGSAWLKRRFPSRSSVHVHLLPTGNAPVSVQRLNIFRWGDNDGPIEIGCGLRIPMPWLTDPGDALLGLRLFQAVLHALHAVGDHYDIGRLAAIGPNADHDKPEVFDPFRPRPAPHSYADLNARLNRLAAALGPEQLLLAVKEPMSSTVAGRCRDVREALGTVVDQHTLTAPNVKATAWIIQTPA